MDIVTDSSEGFFGVSSCEIEDMVKWFSLACTTCSIRNQ